MECLCFRLDSSSVILFETLFPLLCPIRNEECEAKTSRLARHVWRQFGSHFAEMNHGVMLGSSKTEATIFAG